MKRLTDCLQNDTLVRDSLTQCTVSSQLSLVRPTQEMITVATEPFPVLLYKEMMKLDALHCSRSVMRVIL